MKPNVQLDASQPSTSNELLWNSSNYFDQCAGRSWQWAVSSCSATIQQEPQKPASLSMGWVFSPTLIMCIRLLQWLVCMAGTHAKQKQKQKQCRVSLKPTLKFGVWMQLKSCSLWWKNWRTIWSPSIQPSQLFFSRYSLPCVLASHPSSMPILYAESASAHDPIKGYGSRRNELTN